MQKNNTTKKPFNLVQSLVIFLVAGFFFLYEFVIQISPNVMSVELMRSFQVNAGGLGIISGAYYMTYTLMQIPCGLLYDRFGPRNLLTIACFFCALGALLFGMTSVLYTAALGRLLMGIGSAFAFSGTLILVSRWFPAKYFAFMAGCVMVMSSLGSLVGETPLSEAVSQYGWRETIHFTGYIGIFLAFLIYIIVRDNPSNYFEKENHVAHDEVTRLKIVASNKQSWALAIYSFTCWAPILVIPAFIGVLFLTSTYAITKTDATNAISMCWVGVAIGSPVIGWLSDKIGRRVILLRMCALMGLIACSFMLFWHSIFAWNYLWLFVIGFAAGSQTLSFAVVKDNNPKHIIGTAIGFNNVFVVCSGFILQPLVGFLLTVFWSGDMLDGVQVYSSSNFKFALFILPICYILGLLLSTFALCETYCQPFEERKKHHVPVSR